jgi:nicotinate-nucleotide pyrophosphorylase (carboxylating)
MAEVLWNRIGQGRWAASSAGTRPAGYVHPLALRALEELAWPTSGLTSKSTRTLTESKFDLVVTVCDDAQENCPVFPGASRLLHWPFFDPARALGTESEQFNVFRRVRDEIAWRIREFLADEIAVDDDQPPSPLINAEEHEELTRLIDAAMEEDLGGGVDATSEAIVPPNVTGSAALISRNSGVVCGLAVCAEIVRRKTHAVHWQPLTKDGDRVLSGQSLGVFRGSARDILRIERTCLNFLGRLSGVATLTRRYVDALTGTSTRLCDTRKTTPGWRRLEKFAVRCGGGVNHRMGLYDAILIKDNHLAALRMLGDEEQAAVRRAIRESREWTARQQHLLPHGANTNVQIEIDRLEMLAAALSENPDMILLDNMNIDSLKQAVDLKNRLAPRVILEASGGITLESIQAIAQTGVDRISVGAITHSAVNFDIGLDWQLDHQLAKSPAGR